MSATDTQRVLPDAIEPALALLPSAMDSLAARVMLLNHGALQRREVMA